MASEQQTFDLTALAINYWQLILATVMTVIAGFNYLQKKELYLQNKKLHGENLALQKELADKSIMSTEKLEERRSLERRQAVFRDKSEPLRNKLSLIIMGTSVPKITHNDYLPVSHLFEDKVEEEDFILYCEEYIQKQFNYGIAVTGPIEGEDPETIVLQGDLMNIAEQIETLLKRQI